MTMYAAGLRLSEALHLGIADVDSGRQCLRVAQGKGQKDRYSLLPPTLLQHLESVPVGGDRDHSAAGRPRDGALRQLALHGRQAALHLLTHREKRSQVGHRVKATALYGGVQVIVSMRGTGG